MKKSQKNQENEILNSDFFYFIRETKKNHAGKFAEFKSGNRSKHRRLKSRQKIQQKRKRELQSELKNPAITLVTKNHRYHMYAPSTQGLKYWRRYYW